MVTISEDIRDVLSSVYLHEIANGRIDTPTYNKIFDVLLKLDRPLYGYLRKPPKYLSWARAGMLMTSICGYDFGFYWNEDEEFIDVVEVYKRVNESVNKCVVSLTESDLRKMVKECVKRILNESEYKPVAHNKTIKLDNGVEVKSLVTLSDGAGKYDIYEDDGCYVVWNRKYKGENNHWYIFPELLSALKKLPNLPIR